MRLTLRNLANKLFNAASLQRISVAERKDMREAALRLEELFDTLHELYYATAWVPTSKVDNAQELWTKVRDLCGFEPGQSPPLPVPTVTSAPACWGGCTRTSGPTPSALLPWSRASTIRTTLSSRHVWASSRRLPLRSRSRTAFSGGPSEMRSPR